MMETGKMTAVVDLVHTVFLKAVDIEKFIQGDGKMIRDMYVFVILAGFFFFFSTIQVKSYADTRFRAVIFTCYVIL